ncbi:hypothetical protein FB45DRAFT_74813 [Roridomyces roridus]|uniref:Uncharacterized protein n=1 Tax=Roridomyces roridus TaxID=1738132 RepID=A0AAD7BNX0_9AGAR|nr:hypothetical protein FB45DRAFT_74813 [Roridomyces roridus]
MTSLGPFLPRELEKEIFQLAAYWDPPFVPTLKLVAWRVKLWVEMLQYRIILLSNFMVYPPTEPERLASVPLPLLCDSVRHLFLGSTSLSDSLGLSLLSNSTHIEDVWLGQDVLSSVLAAVSPELKPRRLHSNLKELFADRPLVDFNHHIFSRLTHLGLFMHDEVDEVSWGALATLPCLTHLSFDHKIFLPRVQDILQQCKSLRCMIYVLVDGHVMALEDDETAPEFSKDVRFVKMLCQEYVLDWHAGALRGEDYWSRADEFIRRRRWGLVDAGEYIMYTDESQQLRVE